MQAIPIQLPEPFLEMFKDMYNRMEIMERHINEMHYGQASKIAYSPAEAAQAVGCSASHIRREIQQGRIEAKQLTKGGKYIIAKDALLEYVNNRGISLKIVSKAS